MSLWDKFKAMLDVNDEDDYEYEDEYGLDEEEPAPVKKEKQKESRRSKSDDQTKPGHFSTDRAEKPSPKTIPISRTQRRNSNMELCVFKPVSVEDEKEIVEALLSGKPVFLDITGLNIDVAQRIIDFLCGATFAINGNLQKASDFTFIATPNDFDISGDTLDLMESIGLGGPKI